MQTLVTNGRVITDSPGKVEVLNQFYSVFTDRELVNISNIDQLEYPIIP